jgi:hypothetical protein
VGRVVELVYVAWDVKGFADEVWGEADEALREVLKAISKAQILNHEGRAFKA